MPFYPGGGGGGSGSGDVTADPAITNWDAATDGMFLASNGDATATFEDLPSKGTGATDGHVWTADGANGAGWEAAPGAATALKTPDGGTSVTRADVYPVKAYGASGSNRIFRCTTSGSTVTTTVDHDFEVGHALMLLRAGANCSVLKPAVAGGALTPGGTPGSTTYRMAFSAGDGNGGWTGVGASDYVETTTGAATITATNYLEAKIPVPYGAASIAIYFAAGAAARKLVTILNTTNAFTADEGALPAHGAATIDNNGGFVRLTVASGHGLTTGDRVNFHAVANTEYNAQHTITGTTATTLTTSTAYGSATASGYYRRGFVTWRYKGTATPLNDIKGMPDVTNPHWNWRASVVEPRGNVAIDTAGGRLVRNVTARGARLTASAEPTWSADANTNVLDGNNVRRRTLDFVSVDEPSADIPGALWTTVATVPTTTTFTLTDAPTNAIASSTPYLLAHNDAPAWRLAFAAAEASGRGGTVTADGTPQLYFRKHTLDANMSQIGSNAEPVYVAFRCRSGVQGVPSPTISVRLDPNCIVQAHYMQVGGMYEDLAGSITARTSYYLFHFGGESIAVTGGAWEWNVFSGGLTEHYSSESFGNNCAWSYDQGNSSAANLGARPYNTLIADCRIDWPNIGASNGITGRDNYGYRNLTLRNVKLHYGGGNGDQTFSSMQGAIDILGCEIWNTRRHGSHGLYWGVDGEMFSVVRTTFKEIQSANNSIQLRGSSGAGYVKNVVIAHCYGINTGPILLGDPSTSNRVHNIALTGNQGFPVSLSEARNVSIVGGGYTTISIVEDVDDLKLIGLKINRLSIESSDTQKDIKVTKCTIRERMNIAATLTETLTVDDLTIENPHTAGTIYNGYTYEWVATGTNNEYYCRLRATGGDPSISSPSAMRIRQNIAVGAGLLGSLGDDTWFWGYPDGLAGAGIAYQTIVVKIGDSTRYDPDENPYGEVMAVSLTPGITFGGTIQNSRIANVVMRKTVDSQYSLWGNNSGSPPSLIDVLFENVLFEQTGLTYAGTGTNRVIDWSTTSMGRCEQVEFFKCKWRHIRRASAATHSDVRMSFSRGGSLTFRECEMLGWGSGCEITAPAGGVHLIGNKIQSDEAVYTVSTADTFTHIGTGYTVDLGSSTSDPVMVRAYGSSSLPAGVSADTIYYRNNSTLKLYATASDAASNTSPIDITTANGPVILKFLAIANRAYLSAFEFLGDTTSPDIYGEVRGNLWRGSPAATYAAIGANQSDYQLLPLVNKHRLSSDASREVDGFNAPGAGNTWREDQIWNVGAQDIVIKDDTDTGSVAQNRVANHTNADITVSAGEFMTITYDVVAQVWRTIGYTP